MSERQPNKSSYVKLFPETISGVVTWIYKTISGIKYITPSTINSVYLPADLVVMGTITNPSDIKLKQNINDLSNDFCDNILKIADPFIAEERFKGEVLKLLKADPDALKSLDSESFYLKDKKIPLYKALDIVVPFLALAQAIGRIGCLLNGCCFGG